MNRPFLMSLVALLVLTAVIASIVAAARANHAISTGRNTHSPSALNTNQYSSGTTDGSRPGPDPSIAAAATPNDPNLPPQSDGTPTATRSTNDPNPNSNPAPENNSPNAPSRSAAPTANPSTQTANAPTPQPEGYWVERVPINGQDLADLNELTIWKYRFRIPRNQYTHYLWLERWEREGIEPVEVRELATLTGVWEQGDITIKLPSELDSRLFVRLEDTMLRENAENPVQPPEPWRLDLLDNQQLPSPTNAIYLMAYTYNAESVATGGLDGAHEQNDVTVYIKMRFAPGEFVPFDAQREVLDLR